MLDELGIKYGTDKASEYPFWNRMWSIHEGVHDYLRHYEKLLSDLRYEKFTLVEIGVLGGASLRMWKGFFPNATIVGIDIDPACKQYEEDRIEIHITDGTSEECAKMLKAKYQNILVIIDDGGHTWNMQQTALERLFPVLEKGGIYIIEDILSYSNQYDPMESTGKAQSITDFLFDRIRYLSVMSRPDQKLEILRRMPPAARYISENLDSAHFWNWTCAMKKMKGVPTYSINIAGNVFRNTYLLHTDNTLGDAVARQLQIDGMKALVVADADGKYFGFLTVAHTTKFFSERGETALSYPLSEVVDRKAVILPDFSDAALMEAQRKTGHQYYPVVDKDGNAIGIKYALRKDF